MSRSPHWLAHELWPRAGAGPHRFGAVGRGAACRPSSQATLYFHPDPPFAVLAVAATALVIRALRTRLTIPAGIAAGIVFGAASLTRQSAPIIALPLLAAVVLIARRGAWRYAAAVVAIVVVAAPWWYHQIRLYGNPVQSNLNRPGRMLDHQPAVVLRLAASSARSRSRASTTSPTSCFPRFHAYLWSDWNGGYHL